MEEISEEELQRRASEDDSLKIVELYIDVKILCNLIVEDRERDPHRFYGCGIGNDGEASTYIGNPKTEFTDGVIFHHLDETFSASEKLNEPFESLLALQEIHELCHWALLPKENARVDPKTHSEKWNRIIKSNLNYIETRKAPF